MKKLMPLICFASILIISIFAYGQSESNRSKVVLFEIREEIAPSATRLVSKAMQKAREVNADLIVIDMDTYGGLVTDADSIRYAILSSKIPVVVYINPNAASAGALISIACKRIYMSKGANIGAATVVTQDGSAAPDKFQSYMRSIMRSTAKSHGKDTLANGDTVWKRNPDIAEAMVDQDIEIEGITEKGKVLTFTPDEAMKHGFCNDILESLEDVYIAEGLTDFEVIKVEKSTIDIIFGFLKNPAVSGILVLLILGGIYYELQSPGLGFPIVVSIIAAMLYFAPNYIDGLAANWEIVLFVVGVILIGVEIFVLPGFGVAGITGGIAVLAGLILSMVGNDGFDFTLQYPAQLGRAFGVVTMAIAGLTALVIFSGATLHNSKFFRKLALTSDLADAKQNFEPNEISNDATAVCHTDLRPQGKIFFNNKLHQAQSISGYIDKGSSVRLIRLENNSWLVEKI
jgi:membrane-bound serine protease (ClpP class)